MIKKSQFIFLAIAGSFAFANQASADTSFCESPWLKQNTKIHGSVNSDEGRGSFDVQVLSVNANGPDNCQAKLNLSVKTEQGKLPVSGQGVLNLNVKNNKADVEGVINSQAIMKGKLQAQLNVDSDGLLFLKPTNKVPAVASTLGPVSVKANANGTMSLPNGVPLGRLNLSDASLKSSSRKVSVLKSTKTQLGTLDCQTISYTAKGSTGTLAIPDLGIQKPAKQEHVHITETYCPKPGLITNIEFKSGHHKTTFQVDSISKK